MSYYVRLEIAWDGEGPDPFEKPAHKKIMRFVKEYLQTEDKEGRLDWLEEFGVAFGGSSPAEIKHLELEWTESLLAFVTLRFPEAGFWARGIGEEFKDAWALYVRDGETIWAGSLDGEARGGSVAETALTDWPEPLEFSRVVQEFGLNKFVGQILSEQPPTAPIGALTVKRGRIKKPKALVFVGPLDHEGFERIKDLMDTRYSVQLFRDPRKLLKAPVATSKEPQGY